MESTNALRWARRRRVFVVASWSLWIALTVAISVLVLIHPVRSTFEVYHDATIRWWWGLDIYRRPVLHGFLYLPISAMIFSPFASLGVTFGDLVWRFFSVSLFTYGLWRLVRLAVPGHAGHVMAVVLLLLIPCSGVNIQRSQAEVAMAAFMFLGAAEAGEARWWRAALWLALAAALKPLAMIAVLMFGFLYRPLRGRLALGLAAIALLPFLHFDPGYVADQYALAFEKLLAASQPGPARWNEIGMMLSVFGVDAPAPVMTALRALAALATLGLATAAVRCLPRAESAVAVVSFAVSYLVVFNPRTELGSYMNLAAVAGLYLGVAWYRDANKAAAVLLAVLILGLGTQAYGDWIFRPTDVWLKPALGLLFYLYLARRVLAARKPNRARIAIPNG